MKRIEELHQVLELLKKHDLPISPILEYAIKEREEQYLKIESQTNEQYIAAEPQPNFAVYKKLEDYTQEFANLSVGVVNGKKLPHKAILLLSIMHLIEIGDIEDNSIPLDKTIKKAFDAIWSNYCGDAKQPSVWTPFWYMKSESFWHFKAAQSEDVLRTLLRFAGHPSIGQMRPVIKYAYFDDELYNLMINHDSRNTLKNILENNYFS